MNQADPIKTQRRT